MAVYVNAGHRPEDGGKPWKHLDPRCPVLRDRAGEGWPVRRVRNVDATRPPERHTRRRCPVCFGEGAPVVGAEPPRWLEEARMIEAASAAAAWTYDLMLPAEKLSQVGMASRLHSRLRGRWLASCRSRFGPDAIPWLHDLLHAGRADELVLDAEPHATRAAALAAEKVLRARKREDGWQVTSDV